MSFSTALPTAVENLVKGINDRDNNLFMSSFVEDAIVIDEGKQYNGLKEISAWSGEALIGHGASVLLKEASRINDKFYLYVIMDGDFVADYSITEPFPLYFEFAIKDDTITSLLITDWDTTKPTMMAVWANKANLIDPLSSIRISKRPQPTPPPGWVKVKVNAVSLNYHDIFTLRGLGMYKLTYPLVIGCEGSGTLEDGTEVVLYPVMGDSDFKGDETLDPRRHVLSELTNGSLAEYVRSRSIFSSQKVYQKYSLM
jgi:hypothetical protein